MIALMTSFAPVAAPVAAQAAHDQQPQRAPANFGAAVSHRDMVREKLRVDPAAVADKKRPPPAAHSSEPRREEYETEDREPPGRYIDIEV